MNTILGIALIIAMIATVVMLVRGIIAFLRTSTEDLQGGGVSQGGLKQNKMMRARIMWQAIAIVIVILLLALGRSQN